jgi:CDGSH iron-sulfur domain-containing protein 3
MMTGNNGRAIDSQGRAFPIQHFKESKPTMPVTIRCRPNGPFLVEGEFTLVDSQGRSFTLPANKPAVALCRCGQSGNKPFCDGTHKGCGFVADEPAPTPIPSA